MRFLAFATDYDGTIADDGHVSKPTLAALDEVRRSGRKLVLVTGRTRDELLRVLPEVGIFDLVVLENGAVLYDPSSHATDVLGQPPPEAFFEALRLRGIRYSRGQVICATAESNARAVFDTIHELGVELAVVFNKGSAMVLPSGINKATGLRSAADRLTLSRHNVVAAGDAENDHVLLASCHIGVAVANALPALKAHADYVTRAAGGDGVREFVMEHLLEDCRGIIPRARRHSFAVGTRSDATPMLFDPDEHRALVVGPASHPRSDLVQAIVDGLVSIDYRVLVIDTEGDLSGMAGTSAILRLRPSLGATVPEEMSQVIGLLGDSVAIDLSWLESGAMATVISDVMGEIRTLRARHGVPHWVVLSDARRVIWTLSRSAQHELGGNDASLAMVTSRPDALPPEWIHGTESLWVSESTQLARAVRALGSGITAGELQVPVTAEPACVEIRGSSEVSVSSFRVRRPQT